MNIFKKTKIGISILESHFLLVMDLLFFTLLSPYR